MENKGNKAGAIIHWLFTLITLGLVVFATFTMMKSNTSEKVGKLESKVDELEQKLEKLNSKPEKVEENELNPVEAAKTAFAAMTEEYKTNPSLYETNSNNGSEITVEKIEQQFLKQPAIKNTLDKGDWKITLSNGETIVKYTPKNAQEEPTLLNLTIDENKKFVVVEKKQTKTKIEKTNEENTMNKANNTTNNTMGNTSTNNTMNNSNTMNNQNGNNANTMNSNNTNNMGNMTSGSLSSGTPIKLN